MALNVASSLLSTVIRSTNGIQATPARNKPADLLQLYDIENCPYCRLVREALTELDLDLLILPCPKQGKRFRKELTERGGKAQFPYLIDPNTGVEMYESLDIVAYLFETYGGGKLPVKWRLGNLQTTGSVLASAPRMHTGMRTDTGASPEQLLELYSFESSPYSRLVREKLCAMEIPYIVRNCGRTELQEWLLPPVRKLLKITPDSKLDNRRHLQHREGRVSIPYLYDPNAGHGLFESGAINCYLEDTYGA
jgi:glutaredoxin